MEWSRFVSMCVCMCMSALVWVCVRLQNWIGLRVLPLYRVGMLFTDIISIICPFLDSDLITYSVQEYLHNLPSLPFKELLLQKTLCCCMIPCVAWTTHSKCIEAASCEYLSKREEHQMTSIIIAAVVYHAVTIENRIPVLLIANYNTFLPMQWKTSFQLWLSCYWTQTRRSTISICDDLDAVKLIYCSNNIFIALPVLK